jgi:hypothetical protein
MQQVALRARSLLQQRLCEGGAELCGSDLCSPGPHVCGSGSHLRCRS